MLSYLVTTIPVTTSTTSASALISSSNNFEAETTATIGSINIINNSSYFSKHVFRHTSMMKHFIKCLTLSCHKTVSICYLLQTICPQTNRQVK